MDRVEELRSRIVRALAAERVEVQDDSALHAGHAGARSGGGHFSVLVVSERLAGLDRVSRHRLVYEAAGDMIPTHVHALSVRALTPDEWRSRSSR